MTLTRRKVNFDDMELLFGLSKRAMRRHIEENHGPWNESDQRERFFRSTDPANHELICKRNLPIGYISVDRATDAIHLRRISIIPEFQNRGIGSSLIKELMAEAAARGQPLKLRVFPENPARRLYQRLGFSVVKSTDTHVYMTWQSH